jgi:hypothetical protein
MSMMSLRFHLAAFLLSAVFSASPAQAGPATGQLQVFTAMGWESRPDSAVSTALYVHSAYRVLTPAGQVIRRVGNAGRTATYPDPDVVSLAAGNYRVWAQAAGRGRVDLPVTIAPGRKTVIYLDKPESKAGAEKVAGR